MATASKTWGFTSNAQSWAATNSGTGNALAWSSTNGHTDAGCLNNGTTGKNRIGAGHWDLSGTWESLFGIPSGSTVTAIMVSTDGYWGRCLTYTTGAASTDGPLELRDGSGNLLLTLTTGRSYSAADSAYVNTKPTSGQQGQAIPSAQQPSASSVALRLNAAVKTGNSSSASNQLYQDDVTITITYTPPPVQVTASDSVSESDSVARGSLDFSRTSTDTDTLSESSGQNVAVSRTSSDSVSFSDAVVRAITLPRGLADTESFSEASGENVILIARSAADSTSVSDMVARLIAVARAMSDSESFSDSASQTTTGGGSSVSVTATDTFSFSDSVARAIILGRLASDAASLEELAAANVLLGRGVSDVESVSDAPLRAVILSRTSTDTGSFSEVLARTVLIGRSALDGQTVTEIASRALALTRVSADAETFGDSSAASGGSLVVVARDSLMASDSASVFTAFVLSQSGPKEVFSLREAWSGVFGVRFLAQRGIPVELRYPLAPGAPLAIIESFISPRTYSAPWKKSVWRVVLSVTAASNISLTVAAYRADFRGNVIEEIVQQPAEQSALLASPVKPQALYFTLYVPEIAGSSRDRILLQILARNMNPSPETLAIMASESSIQIVS